MIFDLFSIIKLLTRKQILTAQLGVCCLLKTHEVEELTLLLPMFFRKYCHCFFVESTFVLKAYSHSFLKLKQRKKLLFDNPIWYKSANQKRIYFIITITTFLSQLCHFLLSLSPTMIKKRRQQFYSK